MTEAAAAQGLRVRNLTVSYAGVEALRDVSFDIPAGHMTAVLGPNGAGKTTLLRAISQLVSPVAGQVLFNGADLTAVPAKNVIRLGVAHVPEGRGIIPELTVDENLRIGATWRRLSRAAMKGALGEVFDLFPELVAHRHQLAGFLSGGERQMLTIGRAVMSEPRLIMLDEPSLGLAPRMSRRIFATLQEMLMRKGVTILIAEQNAHGALSIADSGVLLSLGKVVAHDGAQQLLTGDVMERAYLGKA